MVWVNVTQQLTDLYTNNSSATYGWMIRLQTKVIHFPNFQTLIAMVSVSGPLVLVLVGVARVCRGGGLDVEDWIARGYTCSLAEQGAASRHPGPGVELVCDDGVCSQCVKVERPVTFRLVTI